MILHLFSVAFVAFLFWSPCIKNVQTSRDIDLNRDPDPEDLSDWNQKSNIQDSNDINSSSSDIKGKMAECVTPKAKKRRHQLKYRDMTYPIMINIDEEKASSLKVCELEMIKQANSFKYYWHNHSILTKDEIRPLCLNAWLSSKPLFNGNIPDRLEPDCDGALVLGPSDPSSKRRKMTCYFKYVPEMENKPFQADMLRCNCAYTEWYDFNSKRNAFGISKQFFYMVKVTDQMYCIFTIIGKLESRNAEIVSVYKP